jgi:hypothetical protein
MEATMPQLAIYLDEDTARLLDAAARAEGLSRSNWVRNAINRQIQKRFSEGFFELLGSWQDEREPEEILAEIRAEAGTDQPRLDFDQ